MEAVTTATHMHVWKPPKFGSVQLLADWAQAGKDAIAQKIPPIRNASVSGRSTPRKSWANSALRKHVHLTEESDRVGTITVTYDEPSPILRYPTGYRHDLSLVTGSNLPNARSPATVPKITRWADYDEALDGKPAFVMRLDGASRNSVQPALVEGTAYFWDAGGRVSASLFWRTPDDFDDVSETSGAVLCLGRPGDEEAKAVVFQNYEAPMREWADRKLRDELVDRHDCLKGGFVLPQEIRQSEILSYGASEVFGKLDIDIDMDI
jgi:hypothetical protein